jgi:uncharacterized protein
VGDFTTAEVLEQLREYAPVEGVHGNMDEPDLKRQLPERTVVEAAGMRIGLVHDAGQREGRHERLRAWFPSCDLIAYGRTHLPEISRLADAWVVNPGSPTERRRAAAHTLIVLERGDPELVQVTG